jgi:IclR family transcriptional regulator, KDG regulon repressor
MAGGKKSLSPKPRGEGISAALRTMTVLEALSEGGYASLETLAEKVGLSKPTLFRFLRTLKALGYVLQRDDAKYSLSLKMLNIGSRVLGSMDLLEVSTPVIEGLARHFGETVHLAVMVEYSVVYVKKVESKHTIRMYSNIGKQAPLYCTSLGKALLAWSPDRKEILAKMELLPFTEHTIRSKKALAKELEKVRDLGYSVDAGEHEADIHCLGAPIFDHTGAAIAAISVSWPVFRHLPEKEEENARVIQAAGNEISRLLGHEYPSPKHS